MTAQPAAPFSPATVSLESEALASGFIETYYADGVWHSRRHDCDTPFASDDDELEQIALRWGGWLVAVLREVDAVGTQVARWNRIPHIVRTRTGAIAEVLEP